MVLFSEFDKKSIVPGMFPLRNRIISGMSDCVIVVEARERSGSLITADLALEQGREVFALPGRICDPISGGCNELIKNGAQILTKPEDILHYLHIEDKKISQWSASTIPLTPVEKLVLEHLEPEVKHVEQLLCETGLPLSILLEALLWLRSEKLHQATGKKLLFIYKIFIILRKQKRNNKKKCLPFQRTCIIVSSV